jgi:hypothetical protein
MRVISDILRVLVLLLVMRFLDGMQYKMLGWSLMTLLGIWGAPK